LSPSNSISVCCLHDHLHGATSLALNLAEGIFFDHDFSSVFNRFSTEVKPNMGLGSTMQLSLVYSITLTLKVRFTSSLQSSHDDAAFLPTCLATFKITFYTKQPPIFFGPFSPFNTDPSCLLFHTWQCLFVSRVADERFLLRPLDFQFIYQIQNKVRSGPRTRSFCFYYLIMN
jgi:hypothetical protein